MSTDINVNKPFLPPMEEYNAYVREIWQRNWLTNDGPLVRKFESELKSKLGIPHFLFISNGTIALQIAIEALQLKNEVLTTPFSYIATCSSLIWQKCEPIFVDIDPVTFNVDPDKIRDRINARTSGMLFTHVFGNPCDHERIHKIASENGLPVIYDAAHAVGSKMNGKSVMEMGDISCTSFHATKLLHTIEGGGVFTSSESLVRAISLRRNFGHDGFYKFTGVGINGKNSEFHAAMGLCNLPYLDQILDDRKRIYDHYMKLLGDTGLLFQKIEKEVTYNHSYFPVVFESESQMKRVINLLTENRIHPRRYFYPSLNTIYDAVQSCPVSEKVASGILCLPVYHGLEPEHIERICHLISSNI